MIAVTFKKDVNDEKLLEEYKGFLNQIEEFELKDEYGLSLNEAKSIIVSNDRHIFEAVATAYKAGFLRAQAALTENKVSN